MPKAVITLDDSEPGGVGLSVFLEGGFDKQNPAHVAAMRLVDYMEQMSQSHGKPQEKTITGTEADWIVGDVTALPTEQDDTQKRVANLANIARTPAANLLGH